MPKLQCSQWFSDMSKSSNLRLVDNMVGFQLDGELHSKFRGEGAHGGQGS